MEFTLVEGLRVLKFDLVLTLALAALMLFVGYGLQRRVRFLERSSIPAAAVGGFLFALLVLALRAQGVLGVTLDTSLRAPLQTIFFTTIGLSATLSLLRAGGWRMGYFWLIASATAVVQNLVGIGLARALDAPAPLGVICGALTLTGGPATGLARTADFEAMGITGAGALIIASATFGIFTASIVGNPVATWLIRRQRLAAPHEKSAGPVEDVNGVERARVVDTRNRVAGANVAGAPRGGVIYGDETRAEEQGADVKPGSLTGAEAETASATKAGEKAALLASADVKAAPLTGMVLLRNLMLILAVMGAGALLSLGLTRLSTVLPEPLGALFKLPGYIGAMIVAAIARDVDGRRGWFKLDARAIEALGMMALAFFLVIALMDLKLWELAGLAVPMFIILAAQLIVTIAYAVFVTFNLMGRDYEAAVTTSGHIGFGLGTTANAVANMEALTERYAPAPRSFLIVPVVGGFFIDFSNALIINLFINLMK